jgi:ArsR family transcriptional regulator
MPVNATPARPPGLDESCCLPSRIKPADRARAQSVSEAAKTLADPIRVEILDLLRNADGEVCQCELHPLFDISQPTLSHHLRRLADAGLVTVTRRGRWAYYSINETSMEVLRTWLS